MLIQFLAKDTHIYRAFSGAATDTENIESICSQHDPIAASQSRLPTVRVLITFIRSELINVLPATRLSANSRSAPTRSASRTKSALES